jgi:hypothetical protein
VRLNAYRALNFVADGEEVVELWANARDAGFESAKPRFGAGVAAHLPEVVAGEADVGLPGQKTGRA